ncbi:multidrug/biocide efflux PACE transporter [Oxalobacteraceae bacterium CAVE-383]|nr:multidrug/biocide efflux PACE transporter [Oxalobacteraceae bacterium CAVE-383]
MKNNNIALQKTVAERLFHAVMFETIAIGLTGTALYLLMDRPLSQAGGLAIAMSSIAMLWNMIFNAAFDRAQMRMGFQRTVGVRVLHALMFEIGLTVALVPLAAWVLEISLLKALILDIGVLIFFLFYAFVFNWCYDIVRAKVMAKTRFKRSAGASA